MNEVPMSNEELDQLKELKRLVASGEMNAWLRSEGFEGNTFGDLMKFLEDKR